MIKRQIIPATASYIKDLAHAAADKKSVSSSLSCSFEESMLDRLSTLVSSLYETSEALDCAVNNLPVFENMLARAEYYRDTVISDMNACRVIADKLETLVGEKYWPFPTYGELLFNI